jgi:hypothetical protein
MNVAIDINGVIRDVFTKASYLYEKFYIDENEYSKSSEYNEETGEWSEVGVDKDFKYELDLPIKSLNLIEHFKFPNEQDLYDFFYVDFPMQIFGHSSSTENTTFNDLNNLYLNFRDKLDITLISDEMGKSKPATLFFLSKYGCLIENITFYSNFTVDNVIDRFDIILTANPNIIEKQKNKNVIKYNTSYNENFKSSNSINNLSEFELLLNKLVK